MADCATLAFEFVLLPSALDEKLFKQQTVGNPKASPLAVGVLKELLSQLSQMSKTASVPDLSGQMGNGEGEGTGNTRKKAIIQMMVLRISAFLDWQMDCLGESTTLQLQLLETLLTTCGAVAAIKDPEQQQAQQLPLEAAFAVALFYRWVLRTLPKLNFPIPPGNKAQIYGSGPGGNFCIIDPGTAAVVTASGTRALKYLETAVDILSVPSQHSFSVSQSNETECKVANWRKLDKDAWKAQSLFDLAGYYLYVENCAGCRACVNSINSIDKQVLLKVLDMDVLKGYQVAVGIDTDPFATCAGAVKALDKNPNLSEDVLPSYRRVNLELQAWFNLDKDADKVTHHNTHLRIEEGLPPNKESFRLSSTVLNRMDLGEYNEFSQYLAGHKKLDYGKPLPLGGDMKSLPKSKHQKFRKRDILTSLMRERRPDKILKHVQDMSKMNMSLKHLVSGWTVHDNTKVVRAAARGTDAEYVYVLLAKIQQLVQLKAFEDAMPLFAALGKQLGDKQQQRSAHHDKTAALQQVKMLKMHTKMLQFNETKVRDPELAQEVRQCFDQLAAAGVNDSNSLVLEEAVVTLLNLGEFDFIMARSEKPWDLVQLANHISAAALHFHRKLTVAPADFKKTCRALADVILPVVQYTSQDSKRNARDAKEVREKQWILRLLKRLHNPDVLSLLCAFLITYYNSTNHSSHEIHCELPVLPLSVNSSVSVNEDNLLVLIQTLAKGIGNPSLPWALRVQAEVDHAHENYLAAIQGYLRTLILSTQYFLKPWPEPMAVDIAWDERIFQKMIKCTSELGYHAQSLVLCQFLREVDYPTAFRSLEERCSFDAMDDLYQFLWDVTLLEYAVSMHTKRGEFSRKRRALETISQLEVNTNNNEEILRESRASRRSAFLRYLAANYL